MASIPLHYTVGDFKEFNAAELQYPAYKILEAFAADNTHTGAVYIGGTGTNIGTFADTARLNNVGAHPVGTSVSTTNTVFNQNLNPVTETFDPVRPIEMNAAKDIGRQSDASLNANIIDTAFTLLINEGLGSYRVQPAAPTGGTWTAIGTITDSTVSGGSSTTLWRKISDAGSPQPPLYPVKVRSDFDVQVMTDAEIQELLQRFQNRIIDTGIGQYRVQSTAPAGGTWVRRGNAWSDTRHQVGFVPYAQAFAGTYSSWYSIYYAGVHYGDVLYSFTGYYTGYFSGRTVLGSTESTGSYSLWVRTA